MSTDLVDLKQGNVYLIRRIFDKYRHYEGTFIETRTINGKMSPEFINCVCYIRQVEHIDHYSESDYCRSHCQNDSNPNMVFCDPIRTRYYDAEKVKMFDKVKNLQKAIESRERRSVNMILRKFIGDPNFDW
jgi:hypothetical protein